ncbi:MAG: Rieske (2Fe-2S) protein [Dehalococcoidia bacterium]
MTGFDLEATTDRIGELLERFELGAEPDVSRDVAELLQHIDALHRESFTRLLTLVREADPLLERVYADEVLRMVLPLYELLPERGRAAAPCAIAGNIIPLSEVHAPPLRRPTGLIPADLALSHAPPARQGLRAPVFVSAMPLDHLSDGSMHRLDLTGTQVLLCRIAGEVYAFRNLCPGSVLPLNLGVLDGSVIVCPWHQCRFDGRSGRRLDTKGRPLDVFPVSIVNGEIRLALGVAPVGS